MARRALTRDERRLLAILATGLTDEAAAARLGLSSRTVRRRLRAVMDKLGASSRLQAGYMAGQNGLLDEPERGGGSPVGSALSLWVRDPR